MKAGGEFEKLLRKSAFSELLLCVVFDEAHCITAWGSFRPEYRQIAQLRHRLHDVPFVFASATFTSTILHDIKSLFNLAANRLNYIHRPNDRPNIHLSVQKIVHPLSTHLDLSFLVPDNWKEGDPSPPKFLIFADNIGEVVAIARFLRRRLPYHMRHKIKWFHSEMSVPYKEKAVRDLREGTIWGLCATDSFGMVC